MARESGKDGSMDKPCSTRYTGRLAQIEDVGRDGERRDNGEFRENCQESLTLWKKCPNFGLLWV
jgi:hypothetical protein